MQRDDSFEKLYDQIDADNKTAASVDRRAGMKKSGSKRDMRGGGERGRGREESSKGGTRSKSKSRHRSKSRGRTGGGDSKKLESGKSMSARDLFGDDDAKSPTSSKENDKPTRRPTLTSRSSSCRELTSGASLDKDDDSTGSLGDRANGKGSSETIEQLEVKNALYKEEFKRVQKEKKQLKKAKDAEIEELQEEIAELRKEVRSSDSENRKLKAQLAEGAGSSHRLKTLEEENSRLVAELKETVERASTMVKERETAIDELLSELETVKQEGIQARTMFDATLYKNKVRLEKLDQENDEYARKVAALEQKVNGGKRK